MLLLTLVVLVRPWLKAELKKLLGIIQKKMGKNENGRIHSLGPWIVVAIGNVSKGLLRKHPNQYHLVYLRGSRRDQHPV